MGGFLDVGGFSKMRIPGALVSLDSMDSRFVKVKRREQEEEDHRRSPDFALLEQMEKYCFVAKQKKFLHGEVGEIYFGYFKDAASPEAVMNLVAGFEPPGNHF